MADYVHSMVENVIALKNRDYKRARDVRREDEVDKMERE